MALKEAVFHPLAREVLRSFPEEIRREIGKLIFDLQKGEHLSFPISRPMPSVALGVEELRTKDRSGAYRVFYYVKSTWGILIFHAFVKKSQKTPQHEIDLGKRRLKEMLYEED